VEDYRTCKSYFTIRYLTVGYITTGEFDLAESMNSVFMTDRDFAVF